MRSHHRFSILICYIGLILFQSTAAFGEVLKIGALFHLSGDLAQSGEVQKNSFMIAFEEAKSQFPEGVKIDLLIQDMPVRAEEARLIAENLIKEKGVAMIVSGISSIAAWEVATIAQSHKIPYLESTATEDQITEQGWEYVFRLNPPFKEYGNGLMWFLSEVVKPKTLAMLRAKGFTGRLSSGRVIEFAKKNGYDVVFDYVYDEKKTDFRSVLMKMKEKNPDVVSIASYLNDAVNIINQCKELEINASLFVGLGGGFSLPQFGKRTATVSNYICSISVWNPSVPYPGSKEYYEIYKQRHYAQPNFHGAEAYAAMQVVADVLQRTKRFGPEAIRDTLVKTDMSSIIGPIKFVSYGKNTQQNRIPTYLIQWIDGEMKTIWPPRLACEKYVYPFPGWKAQ